MFSVCACVLWCACVCVFGMYCALFVFFCGLLHVLFYGPHDCCVRLCLIAVDCVMWRALCFVVFVCLCVVYRSVFVCVVCDVLYVVV